MTASPRVVVLSTAAWDRPLWTNKQLLALELAEEYPTAYVNIAMRRPSVAVSDAKRVLTGLTRSAVSDDYQRPETVGRQTPAVLSCRTSPYHGTVIHRRWNRRALSRTVAPWLGGGRSLLWTFTPHCYDLVDAVDAIVYHSVDLLHAYPGVDADAALEAEARLSRRGAVAIASSQQVLEHLRRQGFDEVRLWENVGRADDISRYADLDRPRSGDVVFAGNLSEYKVDIALLQHLLEFSDCVLHLAGPIAEGGGHRSAQALLRHPRVQHHGTLDLFGLARLFASCSVGLIPYMQNRYTQGVFPLKVYEYLAAGLPVVSTSLPSMLGRDGIVVARSPEEFVAAVDGARTVERDERQRLVTLALEHSWSRRGDEARHLVAESFAKL